jgi:hypothetical protein
MDGGKQRRLSMRLHALKIRGTSLQVIRIGSVRSEDKNHSTNLRWA